MTRYEFTRLIDEHGYKIAAEVGVAWGAFSAYLLKHSRLLQLYCIDNWAQRPRPRRARQPWGTEINMRRAIAALMPFGARVVILRKTSLEVAKELDLLFDFVYVDASHREQEVSADLAAWWPKVREGGMLAGHDYDKRDRRGCCGVIKAVDTFVMQHNVKLNLTVEVEPGLNNSWWIPK